MMIIVIALIGVAVAFSMWCLCASSSKQDEIEEDIWSDEE